MHGQVISFSWTEDFNLISGSWDGTARVWNIVDGTCVALFSGEASSEYIAYREFSSLTGCIRT